ncbi:MAG: 3-dehydroquinate synthase [Chlamydiae bacterium]|nr:3-dehydroquinate synthase [Chlamydiota bacterium]
MTPIQIEEHILASSDLIEMAHQLGSRVAIITDSCVEELYGHRLEKHLRDHNLDVFMFSFPGGEFYKTRTTKEMIEDQMQAQGLGKDTCIIALGGGVTLDMAGFIASTYCRGIPYLSCPTTLLSMIDASIGGKTGVNTSFGKNLIGAIYTPEMIFIDTTTLRTLSQNEVCNGLMEMIKHGIIADPLYFEMFEKDGDKISELDVEYLNEAIEGSCRIKQKIVKADLQEKGKRRLLNFGHTIGHALEQVTNFKIPHGEAVAVGMIAEAYLSYELGRLEKEAFERIETVIRKNHPNLTIPSMTPDLLMEAMAMDKKSMKNVPRFVILKAIGSPMECDGDYCMSAKEKVLDKVLRWICDYECCVS